MARPGKVQPGEPLDIRADEWNRAVEAGRAEANRRGGFRAGIYDTPAPPGCVLVKNESGIFVDRYGVLGIAEPIITPNESPNQFGARVTVVGKTPAEQHRSQFVIPQVPLAAGRIGYGMLYGVCVVRVFMVSEVHRYADIGIGDTESLESGMHGGAQLLWVQPKADRPPATPQLAWAIARLGAPPALSARARITGYCSTRDHYMGKLVDPDGDDIDPESDPVHLYCRKAVPNNETDIRYYLPRLLATGYTDTIWDVRWVHENEGDDIGRWYLDTPFVPWCEAEGVQGRVPDWPEGPSAPPWGGVKRPALGWCG